MMAVKYEYKTIRVEAPAGGRTLLGRDPVARTIERHERLGWELLNQAAGSSVFLSGRIPFVLTFRRPKRGLFSGFRKPGDRS